MEKPKIATSALLQKLFKTTDLVRFIDSYGSEMEHKAFSEYLNYLCKEKNLVPEHIINKSDINRIYGHQLFSGTRKPSRDKVIQLSIGFGMSFDEAQELLTYAGKIALHPKIKRDAVIIFALHNKLDINEVQEMLFDLKLPLLGEER